MAHSVQTYYQAAHQAMDDLGSYSASLHGFAWDSDEPLAIISDGTKIQSGPESISARFAEVLSQEMLAAGTPVGALSCNNSSWGEHCGTTNTQGRYSNDSADACTKAAKSSSHRFLHVEQAKDLRTPGGPLYPSMVSNAFNAVIPLANP